MSYIKTIMQDTCYIIFDFVENLVSLNIEKVKIVNYMSDSKMFN